MSGLQDPVAQSQSLPGRVTGVVDDVDVGNVPHAPGAPAELDHRGARGRKEARMRVVEVHRDLRDDAEDLADRVRRTHALLGRRDVRVEIDTVESRVVVLLMQVVRHRVEHHLAALPIQRQRLPERASDREGDKRRRNDSDRTARSTQHGIPPGCDCG